MSRLTQDVRQSKTVPERFWKYVDKDGPIPAHAPEIGPCWLWTGACTGREPRPVMAVGWNTAKGTQINEYASRVSYRLSVGPIPDGMLACHHCDNPLCVNPAHLFLGTVKDNALDMIAKHRGYLQGKTGAKCPYWRWENHIKQTQRLPPCSVALIRLRYASHAERMRDLATEYGISISYVSRLVNGNRRQGVAA